jgi:RNA polymerase sigma-70 factor, ECF subfamily
MQSTHRSLLGQQEPLRGEEVHARALITRVVCRDERALEALQRLLGRRIYAFALQRLGRTDEAESVVNETLWEIWRRADSFDGTCKVSTWALGIARYKALASLRARVAESDDLESVEDSVPTTEPDPFQDLAARQDVARLLRGIASLAPEQRDALEARYFRGESVEAIAIAQHCPKGTVQTRLHSARAQLKRAVLLANT